MSINQVSNMSNMAIVVFELKRYIINIKMNTPAMRSNMLSKPIFASCVCNSDRAYYGLCVLFKDTGR